MDLPNESSLVGSQHTVTTEEDDIAFAAEAAANAVAAADAEQQRLDESMLVCRICGDGSSEGRPILRFLPVEHDATAAAAAPTVTSFTQDIALHIFCGKTASILPSVNQPELEILTKAGLKNKHGIGPEVNAALARTRCAVLQQDGMKEKQFYLVREFEAHLAAIRHTHITFVSDGTGNVSSTSQAPLIHQPISYVYDMGHNPDHLTAMIPEESSHAHLKQEINHVHSSILGSQKLSDDIPSYNAQPRHATQKTIPVRASAGMTHKVASRAPIIRGYDREQSDSQAVELMSDGRVRCGCGGTHWPRGTSRGTASLRNHIMTKRHQKWAEEKGS